MRRQLGRHGRHTPFALDEYLIGHAQLLGQGQHEIVMLIPLIDVHHDTVLAHGQRLAQRGHRVAGYPCMVRRTQPAAPDRIAADLRHASPAGGHAVDRVIVHQHQHAVGRELQIEFHHVDAHADHAFDGSDRIFGIVAPVAAMRRHQHLP